MTFTVIEIYSFTTNRYTLDVDTLDELATLGRDRFGNVPMTISWAEMTITVKFGK